MPANSGDVSRFRGSGCEPPRAPRTHSTAAVTGLPGPEGRRVSRVQFLLSSVGLGPVAGGTEARRVMEACPGTASASVQIVERLWMVLSSRAVRGQHPQTAVMGFGRLMPTSSLQLHRGSPARGLEWSSEQPRHPQSRGHQKAPTWLVTAALLVLAQARLTNRTKEQGAVPGRPSQHGPGPGGGQC